jgi:hypothetical protein
MILPQEFFRATFSNPEGLIDRRHLGFNIRQVKGTVEKLVYVFP